MEFPKRKIVRLQDYDYSMNGAYFVTICTYERQNLFGEIVRPYNKFCNGLKPKRQMNTLKGLKVVCIPHLTNISGKGHIMNT